MSLKKHLSTTAGVFYLLLFCLLFRLLDIFIWKMDEKIGEIILSKSIGCLLIFIFLICTGRSFRDIHLQKENIKRGLSLALTQALLALIMCYSVKFYFLFSNNTKPFFAFNDAYTMTTIILFVLIGNLINTLMEEGLFRGLMLQSFLQKMPFWFANLLQALIFGFWHIPWILKDYFTGKIDLGGLVSNSVLYVILSGIMGLLMGYMYYRTKNLWTSIAWHFIWNCTMNLLIIKTLNSSANLSQKADILFWLAFLVYSGLSILITYHITKKKY